jgi:hypothetical protein
MCPVCLTTAVLIAGSATSTGGLAAIAIKKFGMKNTVNDNPVPTPSKLYRESNGAGKIVPNADQRRNHVDSFAEPQIVLTTARHRIARRVYDNRR